MYWNPIKSTRACAMLAAGLFSLSLTAAAVAGPIAYSVQSNGNDHLYSIDLATGVATDMGALSFGDAEGLSFAGNQLYAIGGTTAEFWNITTPPGTLVGATGPRSGIDAGLAFDTAGGIMYNVNSAVGGSELYTINLGTGAATSVGTTSTYMDGLAIDGSGNAFGIDGGFTDSLYSINLGTGAATLIGSLGFSVSEQFGLTFAGGALYGLSSGGSIYMVNTGTGAATLVANVTDSASGARLTGFEGVAAATVPIAPTWALLAIGAVPLLVSRKRRYRS